MPLEFERDDPPQLDREIWSDGALTVTGAAEFTASSRRTIYELMKSGELAWGIDGCRRKIPRKAAVDLLARMSESKH